MVGGLVLKSWRCLEEVAPYVQQLVLVQVPVEGVVLHMDEHGLLDGPGMAVDLLVHYDELVCVHGVSFGGAVVMYGEEALKCSLTLSPKDMPEFMWGHW